MQRLGKTETESKIAEAMELIDQVVSTRTVRFSKALKRKLHKAEMLLASIA
jgi:hypothetical protein